VATSVCVGIMMKMSLAKGNDDSLRVSVVLNVWAPSVVDEGRLGLPK
jgi:hypothetical protein